MALFRRGMRDASATDAAGGEPAEAPVAEPTAPAEPTPHVTISMSTYGGPTVPASRPAASPGAEEAPPPPQGAPGMPDNAPLRAALRALPDKPEPADVMNVMRQLLQGILYVRVRGDVRALLAEGTELTFAASTVGEKRFLLAFSGADALQASVQADGDTATSALGQPVQRVLQNVIAGPYAGLIIDQAVAGARIVLPAPLIARALDEGDATLTVKNLLVRERTPEVITDIADALTRVPMWIAVRTRDADGRIGIAESRTAQGERRLEVYSHPLEVIALGRGDRPAPLSAAQLGSILTADAGLAGILIDPAGPWIAIDRGDLAAVLALAGE